ncbi:hypothetical protein BJX64DRAFT_285373 [Aspergillus heterothallicus]
MSLELFTTTILQQVSESASLPTRNPLSRINRRFHLIFNPQLSIQATRGLLRTLESPFQGGSEVPPRAPRMRWALDDTERTVYGLTVNKRFVDPGPPPHPLCMAAQGGCAEVTAFLLDEQRYDMDMVSPERFSLLELVVIRGHMHLVKGLLRRGCELAAAVVG